MAGEIRAVNLKWVKEILPTTAGKIPPVGLSCNNETARPSNSFAATGQSGLVPTKPPTQASRMQAPASFWTVTEKLPHQPPFVES